jgi:secreted trypsin-like serine protease
MNVRFAAVGLVFVGSVSCATNDELASSPDTTAQSEQSILRGQTELGRKYVVMIEGWRYDGKVSRCSGTYYAPRVVLTAANCLDDLIVPNSLFVYYGTAYDTDVAQLPQIPEPGKPSVWARADSWERHPAYNGTTFDANIGVIYLDRKLPFDPVPLFRNPIDATFLSNSANKLATVVGWGADKALSADISQYSGLGVKRTAKMPILGSPAQSLYDVNDPNPGLLDATVRSHWLQLDGHNPYGSGCAGDAGGPMFVNQWGQEYAAGVGFWTGLWCENYNLFTRLNPYLPFLDLAYQKGGQAVLKPYLECVTDNSDGSLRAHFGYTNDNGVNVNVPYGSANELALDTKGVRPSLFYHGKRAWAFSVNFAKTQTLTYKLSPTNSPTTTLTVKSTSPRCLVSDVHVQCEAACRPQLAMPACPSMNPRTRQDECVANCIDFLDFAGQVGCQAEYVAYNSCLATIPTDPSKWQCSIYSADPLPVDGICATQGAALDTCLGI